MILMFLLRFFAFLLHPFRFFYDFKSQRIEIPRINFNDLPNELLSAIFLHLSPRQRIEIGQVCSRWQSLCHQLVHELNLVLSVEPVSPEKRALLQPNANIKFINFVIESTDQVAPYQYKEWEIDPVHVISSYGNRLRKLSFAIQYFHRSAPYLNAITVHCKQLTCLDLSLDDWLVNNDIDFKVLNQLLYHLGPQLEEFKCAYYPDEYMMKCEEAAYHHLSPNRLTSLGLSSFSYEYLYSFSQRFPLIIKLEIEYLNFKCPSFSFNKLWPRLQQFANNSQYGWFENYAELNRDLKCLWVRHKSLTWEQLQHFTSLEEIHFYEMSLNCLELICQRHTNLKSLSVMIAEDWNQKLHIIGQLQHLHTLQIVIEGKYFYTRAQLKPLESVRHLIMSVRSFDKNCLYSLAKSLPNLFPRLQSWIFYYSFSHCVKSKFQDSNNDYVHHSPTCNYFIQLWIHICQQMNKHLRLLRLFSDELSTPFIGRQLRCALKTSNIEIEHFSSFKSGQKYYPRIPVYDPAYPPYLEFPRNRNFVIP